MLYKIKMYEMDIHSVKSQNPCRHSTDQLLNSLLGQYCSTFLRILLKRRSHSDTFTSDVSNLFEHLYAIHMLMPFSTLRKMIKTCTKYKYYSTFLANLNRNVPKIVLIRPVENCHLVRGSRMTFSTFQFYFPPIQ